MANKEISEFSQTNSWAMMHGLLLGFWGVLTLAFACHSVLHPSALGWLNDLLFLGSPVVAYLLTKHFRQQVTGEGSFPFFKAFSHTFLMGLYATLWVALATYVYLAFFDNGRVFDAYELVLQRPEVMVELKRMGMEQAWNDMGGATKMVNVMRAVGAANYAGMVMYLSLFVAPVISAVIAWMLRRK